MNVYRHHHLVEYFQHVSSAVPTVELYIYGETYEHRPWYAVVASSENFARMEQIRTDNLKRTGLAEGAPSAKVAIAWLSYNVR